MLLDITDSGILDRQLMIELFKYMRITIQNVQLRTGKKLQASGITCVGGAIQFPGIYSSYSFSHQFNYDTVKYSLEFFVDVHSGAEDTDLSEEKKLSLLRNVLFVILDKFLSKRLKFATEG